MMAEQYVGRVLDRRYQILEFIASGGMAQVFRAVHVGTGRPLAVKVLKPKARGNPDNIRRFQREARLMATLEHENIIDIIDVQTDEEVYLVMELLTGVDLRVYLRRYGRLAWPEVRAIMLQICDAMQFAHDRGVVHRDLKPANCFRVDPGGRIKVLDLGIARPIAPLPGDPSRITLTGIPTGTPAYMAPEHFCGQADVQTDIWSAGVLMFELLTGRRPFVGEETELLRQIVNTPMPPLASVAGDLDCPPDAEAVLELALAKLPEQRYASMRAFAGAIAALDAPPTVVTSATWSIVGPSSDETPDDPSDLTTMAIVRAPPRAPPAELFDAPNEHPELTVTPAVGALPERSVSVGTPNSEVRTDAPDIVEAPILDVLPDPVSDCSLGLAVKANIVASPVHDVPPVSVAPIVQIEASPHPLDAPPASTRRRRLGVMATAACLLATGLALLWRAPDLSEPASAARPTVAVATDVEAAETIDESLVTHAETRPPDDAARPPAATADPADVVHASAAIPSQDGADVEATPPAEPSHVAAMDAPTSSSVVDASALPSPRRPDPPSAEEVARAAASARQKRQRAAERAVKDVLVREGVGEFAPSVKVTVQWSATGEVTEAVVQRLAGPLRSTVEARLRELPAPRGTGPVRVDRIFELQLPD